MNKRLKFLIHAAVALGALASSQAATAATLYPDLQTLPPRSLRFDRVDVGGSDSGHTGVKNVLRFSNTVTNQGDGPLVMSAHIDSSTKRGAAIQRIYASDGTFTSVPTGSEMYYHASHDHYHFDNWGRYQLWTAADYDAWVAGGSTGPEATGSKTTSCILDEEFVRQRAQSTWPGTYNFGGCNPNASGNLLEGLSVGWGDTYDYWRADQWIELSAPLADGNYVLRTMTDPNNVIQESPGGTDTSREDRTSNDAITRFTVVGGQLVDNAPPTGTVMVNNVAASTTSASVTVKVLGRDDVAGVDQFRVSNNGSSWSSPYNYDGVDSTPSQISWNLTDTRYGGVAGGGTKTVYVQFHDRSGRWGPTEQDTIDMAGTPPATSAYAKAVIDDAPLSYWRLGERTGTSAADDRGANPGTYVNSPALGATSLVDTDPDNSAVGFNGSSTAVRASYTSSMDLTTGITAEAWIKPSALPAAGQFASILTHPEGYSLQFNGPQLEFTVMQGGARKRMQAPAGAVQPGGTYHVVGTYDGTTQRLYVNGTEIASGPLTGAASTPTTNLYIGSWDAGSEYFNGVIDDAALYDKALTATRVKAHYDTGRGQQAPPPAAPSALAATAASDTKVDLTWNDNSQDESSFILERSTDSSFTAPAQITIANDTKAYSDTALAASTQYWYRLRARNAVGYSTYSNVATVTTKAAPDTTPASAYKQAVLADTPVSYWRLGDASGSGATDERSSNPGSYTGTPSYGATSLLGADTANKAVGFSGDDSVAVADSASLDLTGALTLEAWIKPNSLPAAGNFASVLSKPESYSLQFNGPQLELTVMQGGVRKRLQAPAGTIQAGQTYHVVGTYDGTTQRLYVNGSQVASVALTGPASVNTNGLRIGAWSGGSEMFDGVIDEAAVYGTAISAARVAAHWDAGRAATPPAQPPTAPSGLTAAASGQTQINLAWNDNSSDETGFVVERSTDSGFTSPQQIQLAAGTKTYSDTGRAANTTYWYRVRAVNTAGSSAWSSSASATTAQTPQPPAAPSGLTATASGQNQVDLTWNDNSSDETGFVLERSTDAGFTSPQQIQLAAGVKTYSDTGRTAATTYWYRVKAVNTAGSSGWSNSVSATTAQTPPPPAKTYADEVTADAPVSWWRLGDTSGTRATDARGVNQGTYRNSPTLGATSLLGTDSANRAVRFNGVNEGVTVADSSSLDLTSGITLEAWIKPTAFPATGGYASIVQKSNAYALQLYGSQLDFTVFQAGGARRLRLPAGALKAGVTYHLVATYDGANQRLYVNGTQAASRAQTGSASVGSGSLGIGFRGGTSEYFNGTIDEAAVYNKALSATRVDAHTTAGGRPSSIASAKSRTKKPRLRHRHTRDRLGSKARRGHRGRRR